MKRVRIYKASFFGPNFKAKVKNCSTGNYELKANDFCLNGKNCYMENTIWTGKRIAKQKKSIVCPCKGSYSFHCGKYFCTINSLACDSLKPKEENKELIFNEVNYCRNDNTLFRNTLNPHLTNTYLNIFKKYKLLV